MPCNDITEHVRIHLDAEERVVGYELNKVTCGGKVAGRGLIRDWVKCKTITDVLAFSPPPSETSSARAADNDYLQLKHLVTVQSVLATYLGRENPHLHAACEITGVDYTSDGTKIRAVVHLGSPRQTIQACGGCSSGLDSPS